MLFPAQDGKSGRNTNKYDRRGKAVSTLQADKLCKDDQAGLRGDSGITSGPEMFCQISRDGKKMGGSQDSTSGN